MWLDFFFFFLAALSSMWDLSPLFWDRTHAPNHWTAREIHGWSIDWGKVFYKQRLKGQAELRPRSPVGHCYLTQRICLPTQEPQEMWFEPLGQEDPLEEEMATYSSILAEIIPWTDKPGGLECMQSQGVRHD